MAAQSIIQQKREAAARRIVELFHQYLEDYPLHEFPTQQAVEDILAEEIRPSLGPGSVPHPGRKRGRPPKAEQVKADMEKIFGELQK